MSAEHLSDEDKQSITVGSTPHVFQRLDSEEQDTNAEQIRRIADRTLHQVILESAHPTTVVLKSIHRNLQLDGIDKIKAVLTSPEENKEALHQLQSLLRVAGGSHEFFYTALDGDVTADKHRPGPPRGVNK